MCVSHLENLKVIVQLFDKLQDSVKCYFMWAGGIYDGAYAYTNISKEGAKFTYIQARVSQLPLIWRLRSKKK